MKFKDIPGKTQEKQYLIEAVTKDQIPHALLVAEKTGGGALALCLAFISYLFCTNRSENDSCGECTSCQKTKKLIHPDLHFAFPVIKKDKKKREDTTSSDFLIDFREIILQSPYIGISDWLRKINAEDKAPNINTTECNRMIRTLGLKSFESVYKVQIIWQAHFLGKEGNRLLKLIEEPPENTIIILITNQIKSILNTILSRCQLLTVPVFSDDEIMKYLCGQYQMDQEEARQLAFLSNGDMSKADELAENQNVGYSDEILNWLRACYQFGQKPSILISWVDQFSKYSKNMQRSFLEYSLYFFREYFQFINQGADKLRLSNEEKEIVQKMSKIIDVEKLELLQVGVNELLINIRRNANIKIATMDVSISIYNALKAKPVSKSIINY